MKSLLPYALSAYKWARQHPKTVLTAASFLLVHAVAQVWTDVPSDAILSVLAALLSA